MRKMKIMNKRLIESGKPRGTGTRDRNQGPNFEQRETTFRESLWDAQTSTGTRVEQGEVNPSVPPKHGWRWLWKLQRSGAGGIVTPGDYSNMFERISGGQQRENSKVKGLSQG